MAEATYYGTGRRKTSVARVRLVPGQGNITINGRTLDDYFDLKTLELIIKQPLELTGTTAAYDVIANVQGGGRTGQAGAIRHGISRALLEVDGDYRKVLKSAGLLTRDPRMKERKKYGLKKQEEQASSANADTECSKKMYRCFCTSFFVLPVPAIKKIRPAGDRILQWYMSEERKITVLSVRCRSPDSPDGRWNS